MFRQNTLIAILFAVMGLWVFIIGAVVDKRLDFEKDGVGIAERDTLNINEAANSGLHITTDSSSDKLTYTFALREDCSTNQVIKAGATTTEWSCANDLTGAGGSAIILDLADDDVNESTDLIEIAITGDTNSIFTEPTADKLLIALASNWPSADTADALDANPTDCAADTFATTIAASGNLTCEAVDGGVGGEITDDSIDASDIDETTAYTWTGDHDFGGGGLEVENNTAVPGSCTVGQIFLDTDATSGQQLFGCEGGSFVLQGDGTGGGSGSVTTVEEGDVQVGGADIVTLDFGAGFDITETPDTEINIAVDLSEVVTGDVTYTGNVAEVTEADALESDPTDCAANTFAQSIAANGDLTCAAVDLGTADVTETLDVSDHINLLGGTNITLAGDTLNVDDAFVSNSGDAITGDLDFNDGATDSPKATFTPATGTAWDIFAEDTGDDLQIEVNTASEEALDIVNTGAGTVRLTLDGGLTLSGFDCTANTNGGALSTDASGVVSCSDDDTGAGAGDVADVGPGCSTGACLTDGLATTGSVLLIWEGTGVDTNEFRISVPANPVTDQNFSFPDDEITDDDIILGSGAGTFTYTTITDCNATNVSRQQYDTATNAWGCDTDTFVDADVADTLTVGNAGTVDPDAISCDVGDDDLISEDCIGDVLDLTEIEDLFLLNTGDVGTGAYDFGGASDFEVPNGTAPTVNADGEIAHDTTSDQIIIGADADVISTIKQGSLALENPVDADRFIFQNLKAYGFTVTDIECIVDPADSAESVVIALYEATATGDFTDLATNGLDGATTITCDNDGADDDGALSNGTLDKDDWMGLDVGVVTGTVTWLTVTWVYTITRE